MKLRFDHQSIRLRVRKSDVEKLSREGFIQETVYFPGSRLVYRLETDAHIGEIMASMDGTALVVRIPAQQAEAWITSETVGVYATLYTGVSEHPLNVMVEKDFPCRHNSAADNADTFVELSES